MRYLVVLLCLLLLSSSALAIPPYQGSQWTEGGVLLDATGDRPRGIADGSGGVVVVWRQAVTNAGIYAQRFDRDGAPLWGSPKRLSPVISDVIPARIAPCIVKAGSVWAVAWVDSNTTNQTNAITIRTIDASGNLNTAYTPSLTADLARTLSMVASDFGGVTIAWSNGITGSQATLAYWTRSTNFSSSLGSKALDISNNSYRAQPKLLNDANGPEYCVFQDNQGDVEVQVLYETSSNYFGDLIVSSAPSHIVSDIADDGAGGLFVVATGQINGVNKVIVQHMDEEANMGWDSQAMTGTYVCPTCTGAQAFPTVATDVDGECIVVWKEQNVRAQKLAIGGSAQWSPSTGVAVSYGNVKGESRAVAAEGGGVTVIWNSRSDSEDGWVGIRAQGLSGSTGAHFWPAASTNAVLDHGQVDITGAGATVDAASISLVPEQDGGAFVLWHYSGGVYVNRLVRITEPTVTTEKLFNYDFYRATFGFSVLNSGHSSAVVHHGPPDHVGHYALQYRDLFASATAHADTIVDDGNMCFSNSGRPKEKCDNAASHLISRPSPIPTLLFNLDPCSDYRYELTPGGLPRYAGSVALVEPYTDPRVLSFDSDTVIHDCNRYAESYYIDPAYYVTDTAHQGSDCDLNIYRFPGMLWTAAGDAVEVPSLSTDARMGSSSLHMWADVATDPPTGVRQRNLLDIADMTPFGEERFLAFSMKIHSDVLLKGGNDGWTLITELWQDNEMGSVAELLLLPHGASTTEVELELRVSNADHYITICDGGGCAFPLSGSDSGSLSVRKVVISKDEWNDIVLGFRANPADQGNGYIDLTVNNNHVDGDGQHTYDGKVGLGEPFIVGCTPAGSPCNGFLASCTTPDGKLKSDDVRQAIRNTAIGIYRRYQTGRIDVWFDEVRFGKTMESVQLPIHDIVISQSYNVSLQKWNAQVGFTAPLSAATVWYGLCADPCAPVRPATLTAHVDDNTQQTQHALTIANLAQAGVYWYRIEAAGTSVEGTFVVGINCIDTALNVENCQMTVTWKTSPGYTNTQLKSRKVGTTTFQNATMDAANGDWFTGHYRRPDPREFKIVTTIGGVTYETTASQDGDGLCEESLVSPNEQKVDVFLNAHPNPFNPEVTLDYGVVGQQEVELKIWDAAGRLVKTLVSEKQAQGFYHAQWSGADDKGARVASGIYFARLKVGTQVRTTKLALLK